MFVGAGTATLQATSLFLTDASGGSAGPGGSAGNGLGGGAYVAATTTVTADAHTHIFANHASTSNDDIFGNIDLVP
jgi:hypothetical protein